MKDIIVTMTDDDLDRLPPPSLDEILSIESAPYVDDVDCPLLTKKQLSNAKRLYPKKQAV